MKTKVAILFFLVVCSFSYGQELRQQKTGTIQEFEKPISGVHVYNLNTLNGTSTREDGRFSIPVKLNDTLIVSHINYRSLRIIISKAYLDREPLVIYMDEMTNFLETVSIKLHDLTGNLGTDSKNEEKGTNQDSISKYYSDLSTQRSLKDFDRNLEQPIFNQTDVTQGTNQTYAQVQKIGFKFKDVELRKELDLKKKFPDYLIENLGKSYFTTNLKIPSDKVYHFITYCEFKNIRELYYSNNMMQVLTILESESVAYLQIKE
ncbi:MAG: hypothetical protein BM563_06540 [Bacteroidetes bacterium MedPE-SWsnd-G1]|nr:MAG: hypothetical protein BM563_06540 [Bacteroidetes bacterium MedPE-SWsnd-G1]